MCAGASLLGYGPITAADVRHMLSTPGTVLRRLVTDPVTGVLVDYGTSRYRPDTHLSGLTKARDVTCRYPGCTRNRDPLLIRFRYPAVSDSQ